MISLAGPMTQIAISLVILAAMGVNPLSLDSVGRSDAAAAIWWAGPAIGALNLIPVLPLDGGHLAQTGLEVFVGKRALRVMAIASVVITVGAALAMVVAGRTGFVIFIAFLLLNQVQILQATSKRPRQAISRSVDVESSAWETGRPGVLEPGSAVVAMVRGASRPAPGRRRRGHGHRARRPALDEAGALDPADSGDDANSSAPWSTRCRTTSRPPAMSTAHACSSEVLLAIGDTQRAGDYAAATFATHRSSPLATLVARAAAALGDDLNAVRWLGAAAQAATAESEAHRRLLARTMDTTPEFARLRTDSAFRALRGELV